MQKTFELEQKAAIEERKGDEAARQGWATLARAHYNNSCDLIEQALEQLSAEAA